MESQQQKRADSCDPTVGVLFSGGLDSAILVAQLLDDGNHVQPIYVQLGLIWEEAELAAARRFLAAIETRALRPMVVLEMPVTDLYSDHWSITGKGVPDETTPDEAVYLPGRNPLLIMKARMWCQLHGIDRLALGCLAGNPFADAQAEFFTEFGRVLDAATGTTVEIVRPLSNLTKEQVLQIGRRLPLGETFSCIDPVDGVHCGRCNKCAERRHAFRSLGLDDPTQYVATKSHRKPAASSARAASG